MTVPQTSAPMFVVGLATDPPAVPQHSAHRPAPAPSAAPAANTSTSTMSHQPSNSLHQRTLQAINDAAFAVNTFNPAGAAQALQKALELTGQLVANSAASQGFAGYSINATNDSAAAPPPAGPQTGEFAGYDLNNPDGK